MDRLGQIDRLDRINRLERFDWIGLDHWIGLEWIRSDSVRITLNYIIIGFRLH